MPWDFITEQPTCILIDGSSYLFRAYYALPELNTSNHIPTGAIYGVVSMLRKLLATQHKASYYAVVFDSPGKTTRHHIYPAYKANRAAMPESLQQQIEPLQQIIRAMGFPCIAQVGLEADDIIGTLAHTVLKQPNHSCIIVSPDKDFIQLINSRLFLFNPSKECLFTPDHVTAQFGVRPDQFIDYLALVGDTSDNIPGVPLVGPKTAAKWLKQYNSVDHLLNAADSIKGKLGETLRNHQASLKLSQRLATILCDLPLNVSLNELICQPEDTTALLKWFTQLEFKRWIKPLEEKLSSTQSQSHRNTYATKKLHVSTLKVFPLTDSQVNIWQQYKAPLSVFITTFPAKEGIGFAVQALHEDKVYTVEPTSINTLAPILKSPAVTCIGCFLKTLYHDLFQAGITLKAQLCDVSVMAYTLNSNHGQDTLLAWAQHYQVTATFLEDIGLNLSNDDHLSWQQTISLLAWLFPVLSDALEKQPSVLHFLHHIEQPLLKVLAAMEQYGVMVDTRKLKRYDQDLKKKLYALTEQVYCQAGTCFNLNSPSQLQTILYHKLSYPILKKTPKGAPSTAESVLKKLAKDYDFPRLILKYRHLSKLQSTYTSRLPEVVEASTGRIHTSYHQTVTLTGRLSSSQPNLQNIPIRTPEGRFIRQTFIAPRGYQLIMADYSQIELRIMAHFSQDPTLLQAFDNDLDVHRATAAELFFVDYDQVTYEQRRQAKAVNFGLIYGMSSFGLAEQLQIDRATAQSYINCYFARYPQVKAFMEETRNQFKEQGSITTITGRRLYFPKSHSHVQKAALGRAAINAPMQGSAADIIKIAMVSLHRYLQEHVPQAHLIMQVHDELVIESPSSHIQDLIPVVRRTMSEAMRLRVPLVVDIEVGKSWK